MKTLKYLLQKEFLQITRDKAILRMIILLPIVQLLILPWAATFEQKNISLSVVDQDRSSYSTKLTSKITSSGYFKLTDYSNTYSDALRSIENNESDLILEIPKNFENQLIKEQQANLFIEVNAVNGQKAGLGTLYINQIIADFNHDLISKNLSNIQIKKTINVFPYYQYNVKMDYHNFMVPGILVMLITLIGGMLSALNIVKEKEIGTIEQINVTPVSKTTFIIGKIIPFWIIGYFVLTIGIIIAWIIYGIFPIGCISLIYAFTFFYLLTYTGIGLVISNYSNTQQQAMLIAFFILMVSFLLSGLFTPISSMPQWAQWLTRLNPVRYFIEVIRLIYLKGSGFIEILPQLMHIIGFSIILNLWAILGYRKTN